LSTTYHVINCHLLHIHSSSAGNNRYTIVVTLNLPRGTTNNLTLSRPGRNWHWRDPKIDHGTQLVNHHWEDQSIDGRTILNRIF
jgi:hypothetical protein